MIKNIIFDLSEVIISGYRGAEILVEKNSEVSAEEFLKRKKEMKSLFSETMRGTITEDEYLDKLLENKNWDIPKEKLKAIIRSNFDISVEGTMEIIKKLKKQYKLILLSDHMKEWIEYILDNNGELNIFDNKYFSYELGKLKSEREPFEFVLEDLKLKAEETLFIDDNEDNVNIAKSLGINALQFIDAKKLEEDLKQMHLLENKDLDNFSDR
jgi:putative hydrolase of the HAD superfamily